MSDSTTATYYVLQYRAASVGGWIDLSKRETPEAAFARLDVFAAAWNELTVTEGRPQGLQVVRREVTDTVVEDPRPAPEAEEAEVAS